MALFCSVVIFVGAVSAALDTAELVAGVDVVGAAGAVATTRGVDLAGVTGVDAAVVDLVAPALLGGAVLVDAVTEAVGVGATKVLAVGAAAKTAGVAGFSTAVLAGPDAAPAARSRSISTCDASWAWRSSAIASWDGAPLPFAALTH